jgi:hypothetical protein
MFRKGVKNMFYLFDGENTLVDSFDSEEELKEYLKDECDSEDVEGMWVVEGTKYTLDSNPSYDLVEE